LIAQSLSIMYVHTMAVQKDFEGRGGTISSDDLARDDQRRRVVVVVVMVQA
jgi:hypothetical protein